MYQAAERLDTERDYATTICYNYAKASSYNLSDKWSRIAYERSPGATTAYNYALSLDRMGDTAGFERLMQECLDFDPQHDAALHVYGQHLLEQGDPKGMEYLEKAFESFNRDLKSGNLDGDDIGRMRRVAKALGKEDALEKLRTYQEKKQQSHSIIQEENLVAGRLGNIRSLKKGV
jgi:hypothetical protein